MQEVSDGRQRSQVEAVLASSIRERGEALTPTLRETATGQHRKRRLGSPRQQEAVDRDMETFRQTDEVEEARCLGREYLEALGSKY